MTATNNCKRKFTEVTIPLEAFMAAERALGYALTDVSSEKIRYDIALYDPKSGLLRFIEVKGRINGAGPVMITR